MPKTKKTSKPQKPEKLQNFKNIKKLKNIKKINIYTSYSNNCVSEIQPAYLIAQSSKSMIVQADIQDYTALYIYSKILNY